MVSKEVIDLVLDDLFEQSPVAFSLSTIYEPSRYLKVNRAYLTLVGRDCGEVVGRPLCQDLPYAMDDPARLRRMALLDGQGHYEQAEIDMLHVSGRIVPTLISAQRRRVHGESVDIEIVTDNAQRKAFERSLLDAALRDAMTGLHNRAAFESHLARVLAERRGARVLLAYVDLNGFKAVNDRYGHAIGDVVRRVVAGRLEAWRGCGDLVARLGGDEFAVVSRHDAGDDLSLARYRALGARIAEPIAIGECALQVGAAIGVAEAPPRTTVDALLGQADMLMYAAKAGGEPVALRARLACPAGPAPRFPGPHGEPVPLLLAGGWGRAKPGA
jgi:diguanylate cyclase (GGDEF)-like protein/PAS domain S-box-containing protein